MYIFTYIQQHSTVLYIDVYSYIYTYTQYSFVYSYIYTYTHSTVLYIDVYSYLQGCHSFVMLHFKDFSNHFTKTIIYYYNLRTNNS